MKTHLSLAAAAAAAALLLTGCGTTEAPAASAESSAAAEAITVTDARGKEVKLDGPATRVVGTEWNVVENLVTLGVMPVGVADVEGYSAWVTAGAARRLRHRHRHPRGAELRDRRLPRRGPDRGDDGPARGRRRPSSRSSRRSSS